MAACCVTWVAVDETIVIEYALGTVAFRRSDLLPVGTGKIDELDRVC